MIFNMTGKGGSGESLLISDTTDSHGGTIRTITGKVVQLQTKTITPTSSVQTVNPDTGYDGFSQVTVNAGGGSSNILVVTLSYNTTTNQWEPDQTFATIVAAHNAGKTIVTQVDSVRVRGSMADAYYEDDTYIYEVSQWVEDNDGSRVITHLYWYDSNGIEEVASYYGTYIYPYFQTKTVTPTTSLQTITYDTNQGYNGLEQVKVNAMPTGSATSPTSISGSSASVSTGTNTITLSKTVSVTPRVTTAGYISAGTAGNSSVSLTASVTTKAAATITPTTSNQTIASGTYLTGTQTIAGDANLVAGNIKSGVQIFGVTGSYTGGSGSGKNIQVYSGYASRKANSYGATDVTLTVSKAGTYNVSWVAWRSSSSGTMGTNLYKNNTSGTNQQTFTGTYGQCITLTNQSYAAGDVLTLYATSGSTSRTIYVGNLIIEEQ